MWGWIKHFGGKLKRVDLDRKIELGCIVIVTIFSVVQWHTISSNNAATTAQTDQLISAAKIDAAAAQQNALAASSFAATEEKINQDLQNAVNKLNAQAQATSDVAQAAAAQANASDAIAAATQQSAEAAQTTATNTSQQIATAQTANTIAQKALEAQTRPWIGIDGDISPVEGTQEVWPEVGLPSSDNPLHESIDLTFKLRNYGASPATKIATRFLLSEGHALEEQFHKSKICEGLYSYSNVPDYRNLISVFPKDLTDEQKATADSCWDRPGLGSGRKYCVQPRLVTLFVGCIGYEDTNGHPHLTRLLYNVLRDETEESRTPNNIPYRKITGFKLMYSSTD